MRWIKEVLLSLVSLTLLGCGSLIAQAQFGANEARFDGTVLIATIDADGGAGIYTWQGGAVVGPVAFSRSGIYALNRKTGEQVRVDLNHPELLPEWARSLYYAPIPPYPSVAVPSE
jgi:hypothetical protein